MFDTGLVELIITLATPHRPLFLADHYMDSYYDKVENIWGNGLDRPRSSFLRNISLLSIGGGHRDLMVWPCLTYAPYAEINALASSHSPDNLDSKCYCIDCRFEIVQSLAIPGVWTSTDHQCILWCKSLVKTIVRVLFDSADSDSEDTIDEWRKKVSFYHFHKVCKKQKHTGLLYRYFNSSIFQRSNGKWFHSNLHPSTVKLNQQNALEWNETYRLQRSIFLESGTLMPVVIHVPLFNKSFDYEMTAEAINIEYHDWVFSCKSDERTKKHWYSRNLIVCICDL